MVKDRYGAADGGFMLTNGSVHEKRPFCKRTKLAAVGGWRGTAELYSINVHNRYAMTLSLRTACRASILDLVVFVNAARSIEAIVTYSDVGDSAWD
jgi:hypothetical protein